MVNCLGTGEATPPEFTNSGSWPLSFLSAYNRHKFVAWSFSETLETFSALNHFPISFQFFSPAFTFQQQRHIRRRKILTEGYHYIPLVIA